MSGTTKFLKELRQLMARVPDDVTLEQLVGALQ